MRFLHILNDINSFRVIKPFFFRVQEQNGIEQALYVTEFTESFLDASLPLFRNREDAIKFKPDVVFTAGTVIPADIPGIRVNLFRKLYNGDKSYFKTSSNFDLYCTSGPFITRKFMHLARKKENFLVAQTGWTATDALFAPFEREKVCRKLKLDPDRKIIIYAPGELDSSEKLRKMFRFLNGLSGEEEWVIYLSAGYPHGLIRELSSLDGKDIRFFAFPDPSSLFQAADILVTDSLSLAFEFMLLDKPAILVGKRPQPGMKLNWVNFTNLYSAVEGALNNPEKFTRKGSDFIKQIHPYRDGESCLRVLNVINEVYSRKLHNKLKQSHSGFVRRWTSNI